MTVASDYQGGATIFQWQHVESEVFDLMDPPPCDFCTQGVKQDGSLIHTSPLNYHLIPLGHFSWKWNETRSRYHTYEKELLSGILTISTNFRALASLPVVWFCDNQATRSFLDGSFLKL